MKQGTYLAGIRRVAFVYNGTDVDIERFLLNAAREYVESLAAEIKDSEKVLMHQLVVNN